MNKIKKQELHEIFQTLKKNKSEYIFSKLYDKYGDLVYRIAFSLIKQRESSEDIKQTVFLKIWKMETEKLPQKNEASWLYSLTKNETFNYIINQKNTMNLEDIYYIGIEDKELDEVVSRDAYNKIISRLNKKEQEIVSLKILANLSFKEISYILDEPIGTIQWRYYKSLHTLKILLGNLSMFILTLMICILNVTNIRKKRRSSK